MLSLTGVVNLARLLSSALVISTALHGAAQTCTHSLDAGWSTHLRELQFGGDNVTTAPDGQTSALVTESGTATVRTAGRSLPGSASTGLPVVFSWSPRSTAFFLNDGEGSGMSSRLRLIALDKAGLVESSELDNAIVRSYRHQNRCNARQARPNVYGVGWSRTGDLVYRIAQSTVNAPCGRPDRFLGYIANVGSNKPLRTLSTRQAQATFRSLLPKELLSTR